MEQSTGPSWGHGSEPLRVGGWREGATAGWEIGQEYKNGSPNDEKEVVLQSPRGRVLEARRATSGSLSPQQPRQRNCLNAPRRKGQEEVSEWHKMGCCSAAKKEQNVATCSHTDGPTDAHTE